MGLKQEEKTKNCNIHLPRNAEKGISALQSLVIDTNLIKYDEAQSQARQNPKILLFVLPP